VEVHVSLVGRKDLSGEIYRQLRRAILEGRLLPGDALPPTREMARSLHVSRSTVAVAYERLWGEGFVASRVGAGTFVTEGAPNASVRRTTEDEGVLKPLPHWASVRTPTLFDRHADYDFRTGVPDASLFPYRAWRRLLADQVRRETIGRGVYAHPAGHLGLRQAIARHIGVSRGVKATADDIIITNGTQQALDVIARVLVGPSDLIATEDPGYPLPRLLFESSGLRIQGVPVDDQGLIVDRLPPAAKLIYVTPSHEWPLGVSMSLQRRWALLEWATSHNAAIVEDDYDSEFRYGGRPLEPLQTIDSSGRVIYIGTFSKTLLPILRLGFIVSPPSLTKAMQSAKFVMDWHTSTLEQAVLAVFIDDGSFARHLRRMRSIYEKRQQLLQSILERDFAEFLEVLPSSAGLHVAAVATDGSRARIDEVIERAWERNVAVQPLAPFSYDVPPRAGVLLGFGQIATEDLEEGLRRLRLSFEP
jgi:GntR family transcriptional regulator/MocR family aminotransferase